MKFMPYLLIGIAVLIPGVIGYWLLHTRAQALPEVWLRVGDTRIRAELAVSLAAKMQGLSNRDELPEGRGMLFSFGNARNQSFWMQGMRFPIDIVWINQGVVVGITPDVDPQQGAQLWELKTYSSPGPADEVLELPAGYAKKQGINEGVRVVIEEE
jgi:uncharacterized protein